MHFNINSFRCHNQIYALNGLYSLLIGLFYTLQAVNDSIIDNEYNAIYIYLVFRKIIFLCSWDKSSITQSICLLTSSL
jgi:hypothetical protein